MRPLNATQLTVLTSLADSCGRWSGTCEVYAPGSTHRSLVARGLVRCDFIGMRSWRYQVTPEGYQVIGRLPVADGAWPPEEAAQLRSTARQLLLQHDHPQFPAPDKLVRDNCGACVLGEGRASLRRGEAPNYAGWARVYVQAGIRVPEEAIAEQLAREDNPAYVEALKRDLLTWPQEKKS